MSDTKIWVKSGEYTFKTLQTEPTEIQNIVYLLEVHQRLGYVLTSSFDKFELPSKVYDVNTRFIDRVVQSYKMSDSNMGVLMNGLKGGGKSVTAKMIANQVGLPIIIINKAYEGIDSFFSQIDFDCVIFIDEYEKIFSESGVLLSVMDGAMTNANGKLLFLLTTNNMYLNDNMKGRPSRIRYIKEFGSLSAEVIRSIVTDLIDNPDYIEDFVNVLITLPIVTIDIIIQMVYESNRFKEPVTEFIDIFNIPKRYSTDLYTLIDDTGKTFVSDVELINFEFGVGSAGKVIGYKDGRNIRWFGVLQEFVSADECIIAIPTAKYIKEFIEAEKANDEYCEKTGPVFESYDIQHCEKESHKYKFIKKTRYNNNVNIMYGM